MILQKIKKSIEKIGIPCFLDYNDATSYCAVLIPETNGKESIKVDIQFIWEDGNPILLADEWIKSLRMNKELKAIVLGSENNYAGFVLRVKVIDVSICSYIPVNDTPKYNISIDNDPTKGTVSGAGQYKEGKTCTISCTPFEQYYFDGWDKFVSGEDNWESDGTIYDNPYSFTVDQDLMFEAIYGSKYHVEVVSAGNGTVSGSGYYEPTETCTIEATPNTGYHFVNWTVSGLELTTDNPYSFIPTGDITITANFIPYYDISVSSSGNGSVSGGGTYNSGETVSLTATPNEGYVFVNWTEGGVEVSTSNPYTFTCTENRTLVGNFAMTPLKITTNANSSVILTNSSNQTYTWNLVEGENNYYGDVEGFALNEITNIDGSAGKNYLVSIDAHALTNWKQIGESAFNRYQELTTFILPSGLTNIGQSAFGNCYKLRNITIPSTTTSIRGLVFDSCWSLAYIELEGTTPPSTYPLGSSILSNPIPAIYVPSGSVSTYQSASAWSNYSSYISEKPATPLTDYLRIDANNSNASVIFTNANNDTYTWNLSAGINYYTGTEPGFALNEITGLTKNTGNIIYVDASKLTSWTSASNSAFSDLGSLYSFIFPDTMTTMGNNVFNSDCRRLETIHLSNSITTIGDSAINSLGSLLSITIPATLTSAGMGFLTGCSNLTSITCLATTPPTLGQYSLNNSNNCPIYVPAASLNAYKTAPVWSTHASRIQPIP